MAMRLYTREEFEAELKDKWKLEPTNERTATTRAWTTPRGRFILVPVLNERHEALQHLPQPAILSL